MLPLLASYIHLCLVGRKSLIRKHNHLKQAREACFWLALPSSYARWLNPEMQLQRSRKRLLTRTFNRPIFFIFCRHVFTSSIVVVNSWYFHITFRHKHIDYCAQSTEHIPEAHYSHLSQRCQTTKSSPMTTTTSQSFPFSASSPACNYLTSLPRESSNKQHL